MNYVRAHVSGTNIDLLTGSLEKNFSRPFDEFSSGALRIFALDKLRLLRVVFTVVVLDFSVPDECEVSVYSCGGSKGRFGDVGTESSSSGSVLDLVKDISESNGWKYSEQRRVLGNPSDPEAF